MENFIKLKINFLVPEKSIEPEEVETSWNFSWFALRTNWSFFDSEIVTDV